MATKKSVFLSDRTAAWIASTTDNGEGPKWSEAINATFDQTRALLAGALPDLNQAEWQIILNTYAGCYMPGHRQPPRIASDMMDNVGAISIEDLTPDYAALVRKVHAMNQAQQLAILYFVQIFWLNKWPGEWAETVAAIKAKF